MPINKCSRNPFSATHRLVATIRVHDMRLFRFVCREPLGYPFVTFCFAVDEKLIR